MIYALPLHRLYKQEYIKKKADYMNKNILHSVKPRVKPVKHYRVSGIYTGSKPDSLLLSQMTCMDFCP